MGKTTEISWADMTWNPWRGCEKVSDGCDNCYMFPAQRRYGRDPAVVVRAARLTFTEPLKWQRELEREVEVSGKLLSMATHRKRVFTCSWSDFFHNDADGWRDEAWDIIRRTPSLTYMILTKRHGRIARSLPPDWGDGYPNVWLGVSVENQFWADRRIPALLSLPARVRFLSCEPLLERVDLRSYLTPRKQQGPMIEDISAFGGGAQPAVTARPAVTWCIVGGESGPGFRPMNPDWARRIRDDCEAAGVAYWFKQHSGPRPEMDRTLDGRRWEMLPSAAAARSLPPTAPSMYAALIEVADDDDDDG